MSKPTNSAARNQMSEFERQCYDWGWADSEERIIKLLEARCLWLVHHDRLAEADELRLQIALIKAEK